MMLYDEFLLLVQLTQDGAMIVKHYRLVDWHYQWVVIRRVIAYIAALCERLGRCSSFYICFDLSLVALVFNSWNNFSSLLPFCTASTLADHSSEGGIFFRDSVKKHGSPIYDRTVRRQKLFGVRFLFVFTFQFC